MNQQRNVEAIYSLSPLQLGMLFHSLESPDSGIYVAQQTTILKGPLNASALKQAWQTVIQRHGIFRTMFLRVDTEKPLQVLLKSVEVPWFEQDWRDHTKSEQERLLEDFLRQDRKKGFEITKAPLMRLNLLRLGPERFGFVWTKHHALADGWTTALIMGELFRYYEAYAKGEACQLPLPKPFRHYINWLEKQNLSAAEGYWRKALAGFSRATALPGQLEPGNRRLESEQFHVTFPDSLKEKLESFVRAAALTPNVVLQGMWALLLGRNQGTDDVLFGETVSGRPPEMDGVEQIVGPFINTLPARVRLAADRPVGQWLTQLHQERVSRDQYAFTPLSEIHRFCPVDRDTPLFQSVFVFENYPPTKSEIGDQGVSIESSDFFQETNYPLMVTFSLGRQLSMRVRFHPHRVAGDVARGLAEQAQHLLETLIADAGQLLGNLSLLSDRQRSKQFCWNQTQSRTPSAETLLDRWRNRPFQDPKQPAVVFEGESGELEWLSFETLETRTNRLAQHLVKRGIGPEIPVGLCMDRSPDMIVGLFGILKAGGCYLPLDPDYPHGRNQSIVEDAGAAMVVTRECFSHCFEEMEIPTLCLDTHWSEISRHPDRMPRVPLVAEHSAYIIYTSGSTGRPKGVRIAHASVTNLLNGLSDTVYAQLKAPLRVAVNGSLTFDTSVKQIMQLVCGHSLVLIPAALRSEGSQLINYLDRHQVDVFDCTPSQVSMLLEPWREDPEQIPRRVLLGGEAVNGDTWRHLIELDEGRFFNLYGPTECTVDALLAPISPESEEPHIGRPIANVNAFVCDAQGSLVATGVPGELVIGGLGLASGYVSDPAKTALRFIPDAFGSNAGQRLYRTGDKVRYRSDGTVVFLGRMDQQVKFRGFRIELGEIESVLAAHPKIRQAAVLLRRHMPHGEEDGGRESGEARLVAYVVPGAGASPELVPSASALKSHLGRRLPEFMVPSAFVFLDALPLNSHGKLDRQALLAVTGVSEDQDLTAPRTPDQATMAALWAKVLNVDRVGIHANFHELGGHSIIAFQLISQVKKAFSVKLPVRMLFKAPTVAKLVEVVERLQDSGSKPQRTLTPVSRDQPLPLSFAQQRLWFLDQLAGPNSVYNVPLGLKIEGSLNIEVLRCSIDEIVRRHEILRTCYPLVEAQPVQAIKPPAPVPLPLVDLAGEPLSDRNRSIEKWSRFEETTPIRPCLRSLGSRPYPAFVRKRPRADVDTSPHCYRRLVHGRLCQGDLGFVRGFSSVQNVASAGVGHPICRFCLLAATMVGRRRPDQTDGLLERKPGGFAAGSGTTYRSAPALQTEIWQRYCDVPLPQGTYQASTAAQQTEPDQHVHDLVGRL